MFTLFARTTTPIVVLATLLSGMFWLMSHGEGKPLPFVAYFRDAIPSYFLAKTVFFSIALIVLGQLLAEIVRVNRGQDHAR
jgi:hypothetical protein